MRNVLPGFAILVLALQPAGLRAQDAGFEFFEKKIRPVLVEHCYECHAANAKKVRGQLLLDSRDGVRKGGVSGPAIEPGDPDKSLLIKAIRYTDPDTKMPKKGKLPAAVIADLEAWVKMGAPDPRDKAPAVTAAKSWDEIVRERRQWWSLQPVKSSVAPTPKNLKWSADPIDHFLLAALEAKGLTPAAEADARTLIRRLSLVLTGLPPSAEEAEEFAKAWDKGGAKQGVVVEALVDRLLASPHFGERWARHWMDIVRFTETHGNEWNYDVHHAWRYRDYLIRAFNADVPYDQLVREHLAGDLLVKPRWSQSGALAPRVPVDAGSESATFNESIIGTAFYRFGEVNHDDCIDLRSIGYDLADNQIDTLTKAFQAMTVACARCHDHKLDAISTRDYHGMLGILRSSRQVAHTIDAPAVNADTLTKMRDIKTALRREMAAAWRRPLETDRLELAMRAPTAKTLDDNPFAWLRSILDAQEQDKLTPGEAWKKIADRFTREDAERTKFNAANFTTLADFRTGVWPAWQVDGHGLRGDPSQPGEFVVAHEGERVVATLLPAGAYTHVISDRLNGTLRSPILAATKKFISFQVFGDRSAAVRLVSNNCQLNYRNFRYLKNEWHWITFPIPAEADGLRTYAELMTKFDNPKYPDQLGALGGGKDARVPWEKTLAEPRSHFGVAQVVLHDQPAPPKAGLAHLRRVFAAPAPTTRGEIVARFLQPAQVAVNAWCDAKASDDDVVWLNALLHGDVLDQRAKQAPNRAALRGDYRKLDAELALPRIVPGLADFGPGIEQPIFTRGDCMKPGEKTPRGFVEVLLPSPTPRGAGSEGSGRLDLANAIAAPDNPLTARVMVNRVWHHLFGAGLVRTVDDFGHVGELPSHPELLDYLAHQFAASPGKCAILAGKGRSMDWCDQRPAWIGRSRS